LWRLICDLGGNTFWDMSLLDNSIIESQVELEDPLENPN